MKSWWLVLAACGDNGAAPAAVVDAGCGDACPQSCEVSLSGNVTETSASPAACPTLRVGGPTDEDVILVFAIPSVALGTNLGVQIDLGAMPVPGDLSSETVVGWSAVAIESIPANGACVFLAGATAVPAGYFDLQLASIAASTAHGHLELHMSVLPRTTDQGVQSDCGAGTTELLVSDF